MFFIIQYTFNCYINMVLFYYLKFKVVSPSKDALKVNNMKLFLVLIRKIIEKLIEVF